MPNTIKFVSSLPAFYYIRLMNDVEQLDVTVRPRLEKFVTGQFAFNGLTEDRALHIAAILGAKSHLIGIMNALKMLFPKGKKRNLLELFESAKKLNNTLPSDKKEKTKTIKTALPIMQQLKSIGKKGKIIDVRSSQQLSEYTQSLIDRQFLEQWLDHTLAIEETTLSKDFFKVLNEANNMGENFLSILIRQGDFQTVQQLKDSGLPSAFISKTLSLTNRLKQTLAMSVCLRGSVTSHQIFESFSRQGEQQGDASILMKFIMGDKTAASMTSLKSRLEFLLESGSPFKNLDYLGASILHYVAANGDEATVTYLISFFSKKGILKEYINLPTSEGYAPLDWAVLNNNAETIPVLRKAGANHYAKSLKGESASDAIRKKIVNIKKFVEPMALGIIIPNTSFNDFIVSIKYDFRANEFPRKSELMKKYINSFCMVPDRVIYERLLKEYILRVLKGENIESLQDDFYIKTFEKSNQYRWILYYQPTIENLKDKIIHLRAYHLLYVCLNGRKDLVHKIKLDDEKIHLSSEFFSLEAKDAIRLLDLIDLLDKVENMKPVLGEEVRDLIIELASLNPLMQLTPKTTFLHFAIMNHHLKAVELILRNPEHNTCEDEIGRYPLAQAVAYQCNEIVELLIARTSKLRRDNHGCTALHQAVVNKTKEGCKIAELLLSKFKESLNDQCYLGLTPLCWAAATGNLTAVKSLCQAGAALDITSTSGDTALMLAGCNGHQETAEYLIQQGANVSIINHYGLAYADCNSFIKKQEITKELRFIHNTAYQGFCIGSYHWPHMFYGSTPHTEYSSSIDSENIPEMSKLKEKIPYRFFTIIQGDTGRTLIGQNIGEVESMLQFIKEKDDKKTFEMINQYIKEARKKIIATTFKESPQHYLSELRIKCEMLTRVSVKAINNSTRPMTLITKDHGKVTDKVDQSVLPPIISTASKFKFMGGTLDFSKIINIEEKEFRNTKVNGKAHTPYLSRSLSLLKKIEAIQTLESSFETEMSEFGKFVPKILFLTAEQQLLSAILENLFKENASQSDNLLTRENLSKLKELREILVKLNYIFYDGEHIDTFSSFFMTIISNFMSLQSRMQDILHDASNKDAIRMFNLELDKILGAKEIEEFKISRLKKLKSLQNSLTQQIESIINWINFGREIYFGLNSENRFAALSLLQCSSDLKTVWKQSLCKAVVDFEKAVSLYHSQNLTLLHPSALSIFKRGYLVTCLETIRSDYRNALAHGEELSDGQLKSCLDWLKELNQLTQVFRLQSLISARFDTDCELIDGLAPLNELDDIDSGRAMSFCWQLIKGGTTEPPKPVQEWIKIDYSTSP